MAECFPRIAGGWGLDSVMLEELEKYYMCVCVCVCVFKDFISLFLERREGREKERERNINVWLPLEHSLLETWPTTQACGLTGN